MSECDYLHLYATKCIPVEELDKHKTESEILYAINGLSRENARGIDELVNEILTPFL